MGKTCKESIKKTDYSYSHNPKITSADLMNLFSVLRLATVGIRQIYKAKHLETILFFKF